ncbi:hypothetical protein BpHYR1_036963 [Brachionus plicatilis]|uniref:EF-hand domain-containing protein n=1 Tax=Brachionus plicatilis TaxID=10195 RepID=A0A3M7Q1M1_BRAPC|nr:hypothetical protein BpHYR1_036963 [Brachionus plicatilis]
MLAANSFVFFLAISSLFCKLCSSAQFTLFSSVYFSSLFWSSVSVSALFGSCVNVSAPFGFSAKDSVKSGGSVHLPVSVGVSGIFLRSNLRLRLLSPFISPIRRSSPTISYILVQLSIDESSLKFFLKNTILKLKETTKKTFSCWTLGTFGPLYLDFSHCKKNQTIKTIRFSYHSEALGSCPTGNPVEAYYYYYYYFMNIIKKGKDYFSKSEDGYSAGAFLKKLDRNNDGKITEEDFFLALNSLGFGPAAEQLARDIFKKIDTNNNGMLDLYIMANLINQLSF